MPNPSLQPNSAKEHVAELFTVQVSASVFGGFLEVSRSVNTFFSGLDGYIGLSVMILSENQLMVLVRWCNVSGFEHHLPTILHAKEVKEWMGMTDQCTHQPVLLIEWINETSTS